MVQPPWLHHFFLYFFFRVLAARPHRIEVFKFFAEKVIAIVTLAAPRPPWGTRPLPSRRRVPNVQGVDSSGWLAPILHSPLASGCSIDGALDESRLGRKTERCAGAL